MAQRPRGVFRALAAGSFSHDLVVEWQREALQNLRVAIPTRRHRVDIRLRLAPGFLVIVGMAALPLAGGRGAVAALALALAIVTHELPALVMTANSGITLLELESVGASVQRRPAQLAPWRQLGSAMLGSILNLMCALGFAQLSRATAAEPRISAMLAVASTISVGWGLAQLLPLVPFSLGRLLAGRLVPKDRLIYTIASTALLIAGGCMTVAVTQQPSLLVVFLASGMFAFACLRRAAQQLADDGSGVLRLIACAEAAVQRGECVEAVRLARAGMSTARSAAYRSRLCVAMAWGAIGEGDPFLAHTALGQLPAEALNVHLVAAYLRVCGRLTEAEALLLRARSVGQRTRETTKLLIDVQLLLGRVSEAAELVRQDEGLLLDADLATLRAAGFFTKTAVS